MDLEYVQLSKYGFSIYLSNKLDKQAQGAFELAVQTFLKLNHIGMFVTDNFICYAALKLLKYALSFILRIFLVQMI